MCPNNRPPPYSTYFTYLLLPTLPTSFYLLLPTPRASGVFWELGATSYLLYLPTSTYFLPTLPTSTYFYLLLPRELDSPTPRASGVFWVVVFEG